MSQKQINKLIIDNLKGTSRDIDFSKKMVFCGGNGSGKSSILDAIKLAFLGEHDELGKQGKNLLQLGTYNKKTEAKVHFEDGDTCEFTIMPMGNSAKTNHVAGFDVDPSLRLNLCPEEFWGKGDTARMETLLQMCGDSSLVTKDFVSNCIGRVRVSGMTTEGEDNDLDDIKGLASLANEIIIDGDISSLANLDERLAEERGARNKIKKNLKVMANDLLDDIPLLEATEEETSAIHDQIHELLSKSEKIGKKILKAEMDMAKKEKLLDLHISILEAENKQEIDDFTEDHENGEFDADPSFCRMPDEEKLGIAKEALSSVKKKIEKLVELKSPEYTKLADASPLNGCMYKVKGNAVFTGSSFALVNSTVSWSEDGLFDEAGNNVRENKEALSELQVTQNKLESDIKKLEERKKATQPLSDKDVELLEKYLKVDYEAKIEELNSEKEGFSVRLKELEGEMFKIQNMRAKSDLMKEAETKLGVAERKCNVIKSVLATVRDMRKDIVSSAVNDALSIVNAVTFGIIEENIEWDGKKMGRKINGITWVPIDTFSGAEKAVTQMGLGVALASRSNFRLAVLDEISRLDSRNQHQLFLNLNELIAQDRLDQYMGFCINAPEDCSVDIISIEKGNRELM